MLKNVALLTTLVILSSPLIAHNHLSKEELIQIVLKQERIIEKQKECTACLEQELEHLKHKLHEKHRYHALKKALHELFGL